MEGRGLHPLKRKKINNHSYQNIHGEGSFLNEEQGYEWVKVKRKIGNWKVKGFQKTYVRIMTGFSDCPLQIGTGALDVFSSGNSKTLKKFYSILELIVLSLAKFLENQKASEDNGT